MKRGEVVKRMAAGIDGRAFEKVPTDVALRDAQAALKAIEDAGGAVLDAEVLAFLMGVGPLEGCWFHERHPTRRGAFWWRKVIRERMIEQAGREARKDQPNE